MKEKLTSTDAKETWDEVYGLRGTVCSEILDRWVQQGVGIPISWKDIVYASWALWPDQRSLISVVMAERDGELDLLYALLLEDLERGEDILLFEGYSPALWRLVIEAREWVSELERLGYDEHFLC